MGFVAPMIRAVPRAWATSTASLQLVGVVLGAVHRCEYRDEAATPDRGGGSDGWNARRLTELTRSAPTSTSPSAMSHPWSAGCDGHPPPRLRSLRSRARPCPPRQLPTNRREQPNPTPPPSGRLSPPVGKVRTLQDGAVHPPRLATRRRNSARQHHLGDAQLPQRGHRVRGDEQQTTRNRSPAPMPRARRRGRSRLPRQGRWQPRDHRCRRRRPERCATLGQVLQLRSTLTCTLGCDALPSSGHSGSWPMAGSSHPLFDDDCRATILSNSHNVRLSTLAWP